MRPSVVFERNRALVRELVSLRRTTNPRVFGSVLHGTDGEGSDIDILVDTLPGASTMDLIALENDLRQQLGVSVQVLTQHELGRRFRDKILAEAEPV